MIRSIVILLSMIWALSASDSTSKDTTQYTPRSVSRVVSESSKDLRPEIKVLLWGDPLYLGVHAGIDASLFKEERYQFEPRLLYGLYLSKDYNLVLIHWHFFADLMRTGNKRVAVDLGCGIGPKVLSLQIPFDLFLRIESEGVGGGIGAGLDYTFFKFHLKTGVIWDERYFIEFLTTAKIPIITDRSKKRWERRRKRYLSTQ